MKYKKYDWMGWCLLLLSACFLSLVVLHDITHAQDPPAFSDPARVAQYMDNQPRTVVALLEGVLTQEQIDALEASMFPEATYAEELAALEKAKLDLQRVGVTDEDDPVVVALNAAIATLIPLIPLDEP